MKYLYAKPQAKFAALVLILFIALFACKKNVISPPNSPAFPPQPDSLGQYTITEVGSADNLEIDPNLNKTINGYTDKISYYPGELVTLYLSGPFNQGNTTIQLKDMRGTILFSVPAIVPSQPINNKKPWVNGFGYRQTITYRLPANFKSGVYTWANKIPFICKSNSGNNDITLVYPSNTMNAYNYEGGKSLYAPDFKNRATVLSFLRSDTLSYFDFFRWLDMQSYNINYIADVDLEDYSQIQNSKVVVIAGHSEYWTRAARENIDKFIASGKNVLFISGDNMWWQVRYNTTKNLMICYKSTSGNSYADITQDPLGGTLLSTINWGPILDYPIQTNIGAEYRNGGYGDVLPNRWNGFKIVAENSPVLAGTGLKNGDILSVPTREYDGAPMVKYYPPGSSEIPVIDTSQLHCNKVELLGFDYAQNLIKANLLGYGTFIVFRKTATSGTIVNVASTNWVANAGINGLDKAKVQKITKNMIDLSLSNASLFSN